LVLVGLGKLILSHLTQCLVNRLLYSGCPVMGFAGFNLQPFLAFWVCLLNHEIGDR
jgi:hypothetical protein